MIFTIIILIIGMVFIYLGAEGLVWGGTGIATKLRISPMVIGLTVVAFGTSLPEFTVSLYSVLNGVNDIALGNIVGSNIANVALILAAAAIVFPIAVDFKIIRNDLYIVIAISILFLALSVDGSISRIDGIILVLGLIIYLIRLVRRPTVAHELDFDKSKGNIIVFGLAVTIGLLALILGTQLFIESAVKIARTLGMSELVIGLTIVAIGTSLPELATSMVAAFHKHSEIVLGNIMGSNVFNLMAVMGVVPMFKAVNVPAQVIYIQLPLMLGLTIILFPILKLGNGVKRSAGVVLLAVYIVFTVYLYFFSK